MIFRIPRPGWVGEDFLFGGTYKMISFLTEHWKIYIYLRLLGLSALWAALVLPLPSDRLPVEMMSLMSSISRFICGKVASSRSNDGLLGDRKEHL